MKKLIPLFFCILSSSSFAQNVIPAFDPVTWKPPYSLSLDGWGIERFLVPPDFAPLIKYTGVEDIRFTKGWGDVKSDEYWTYAFLWYLDGKPTVDTAIIETNLNAYYDGLIKTNIDKRKIPAEKIFATKATIKKINSLDGDMSTFSGSIKMLDYMQQKSNILNCIIHLKYCDGQDKTFLFYEISPQPPTHQVWQSLDKLWKDFNCKESVTK